MLKKIMLLAISVCLQHAFALECSDGQRVFSDELSVTGDVCVPIEPQRIVSMDMGAAELTLFTGKDLVGAANWILAEMSVLTPEYKDALTNIENVGYPANLEKLLALKPDLILAVGYEAGVHQSIDVEKAQKIAPLIVANPVVYDDWKVSTKFWAKALNVSTTYDEMLANYDQRVTEIKALIGDKNQQAVSILGMSTYGTSMWLKDTPPARIVNDLGFRRPRSQDYDAKAAKEVYKDARYPMISEEKLDLADADIIFGFGYPSHDPKEINKLKKIIEKKEKSPLWNSLSGVKNKQFYNVGGHWWRCTSYSLANRVLDDIATSIAGELPNTRALKAASSN